MPARKLIHLVRLALTATAGADVCLANYFTTAYVALASKWLRGDRAVLAYNVRGYEPLSHGLNADASAPEPAGQGGARLAQLPPAAPEDLHHRLAARADRRPLGVRRRARHRPRRLPARPGASVGRARRRRHHRAARRGEGVPGFPPRPRPAAGRPPDRHPDRGPGSRRPPRRASRVRRAPAARARDGRVLRGAATCSSSRRAARGSGCRPWSRWPSAARSSRPTPAASASSRRTARTASWSPPAAPLALAGAIEALVRDPDRRASLREAGIATAADYSQDAVLDRFCRYLVRLAA